MGRKANTLTNKQVRFVLAYRGNATEAAIEAGFSKHTAGVQGWQLLQKPLIKAAIAEQMEKLAEAKIAKRQEVLETLTEVLRENRKEKPLIALAASRQLIPMLGEATDVHEHKGEVKQKVKLDVSQADPATRAALVKMVIEARKKKA